ncbi:MAG: ribosome assembly RNA-binding protein YhbY [Gammaproteobacteria bacterium]|nr:ribosome assembly RNA-binding protein YhbY [Gammaproteobacteria bacterium]
MALTGKQKHQLRALAHKLKPVVLIGANGLTEAVLNELDEQFKIHELIKVKIPGSDRTQRQVMLDKICDHCEAQWVQNIGHIGIFYRAFDQPVIQLN